MGTKQATYIGENVLLVKHHLYGAKQRGKRKIGPIQRCFGCPLSCSWLIWPIVTWRWLSWGKIPKWNSTIVEKQVLWGSSLSICEILRRLQFLYCSNVWQLPLRRLWNVGRQELSSCISYLGQLSLLTPFLAKEEEGGTRIISSLSGWLLIEDNG